MAGRKGTTGHRAPAATVDEDLGRADIDGSCRIFVIITDH
jgi:hypothetical protein